MSKAESVVITDDKTGIEHRFSVGDRFRIRRHASDGVEYGSVWEIEDVKRGAKTNTKARIHWYPILSKLVEGIYVDSFGRVIDYESGDKSFFYASGIVHDREQEQKQKAA